MKTFLTLILLITFTLSFAQDSQNNLEIKNRIGKQLLFRNESSLLNTRNYIKENYQDFVSHYDSCLATIFMQIELDAIDSILTSTILTKLESEELKSVLVFSSLEKIKNKFIQSEFTQKYDFPNSAINKTADLRMQFIMGYLGWLNENQGRFIISEEEFMAMFGKSNEPERISEKKHSENLEKIDDQCSKFKKDIAKIENQLSTTELDLKTLYTMVPSLMKLCSVCQIDLENYPNVSKLFKTFKENPAANNLE